MRRTDAQRDAWWELDPWRRRLLISHRPDELERDEALARETLADLEAVWGPREWGPDLATLAEGECERIDEDDAEWGDGMMTLAEIGAELDLSRERVRGIIDGALRKVRGNRRTIRVLAEFFHDDFIDLDQSTSLTTVTEIDEALRRSTEAAE